MASPLIPLHAIIGLLGSLFYLWVAAELLRPLKNNDPAFGRIHIAAVLGTLAFIISWVMGGFYYVETYGPEVKPLVQAAAGWAHSVGMETKEHIFLFMPFLSILAVSLIRVYGNDFEKVRKIVFWISVSLFILGAIIAVEGFIVTNAARAALEMAI